MFQARWSRTPRFTVPFITTTSCSVGTMGHMGSFKISAMGNLFNSERFNMDIFVSCV